MTTPTVYTLKEFKLVRLRETPSAMPECETPDNALEVWKQIETASWFDKDKECLIVLFLSARRKVTGYNLVSLGTLTGCDGHPREVFAPAIVAKAAAIILMHNHPSGDPTPSEADIQLTRNLVRGGQLLKIDVLDHVVVARTEEGYKRASLRELGYFFS